MLHKIALSLLTLSMCSLLTAAEPAAYAPIPPDRIKEFEAVNGIDTEYFWNREVSLTWAPSTIPKEARIPTVSFDVNDGESLPKIPDAGVPFVLALSWNVDDKALKEVAQLPNLIGLRLNMTKVTDTGIQAVKDMKNLKFLTGYQLKITDVGLKHIAACKKLEGLELNRSNITDAGVKHLSNLTNLRYLNLSSCDITAQSLPTVATLENLTALNMYDTAVGPNFTQLKGLTRLTILNIAETGATNESLRTLKGMKTLTGLDLSRNAITNAVFKDLKEFPNLTHLTLKSDKEITDEGLKDLKLLPNLTSIGLNSTSVTDAEWPLCKQARWESCPTSNLAFRPHLSNNLLSSKRTTRHAHGQACRSRDRTAQANQLP